MQARMDADRKEFTVMRSLLADLLALYTRNATREEIAQDVRSRYATPGDAVRWIRAASKVVRANLAQVDNAIVIEALETEILKRGKDGK